MGQNLPHEAEFCSQGWKVYKISSHNKENIISYYAKVACQTGLNRTNGK